MQKNSIQMDIDLEIYKDFVLTINSACELVQKIFELILFQRNQIPLNSKTFKFVVSKWSESKKTFSCESKYNFEFERYRLEALNTFNEINRISHIFKYIFHLKNVIKSIRILIGPTTLTPKEIYVIKIPKLLGLVNLDDVHGKYDVENIIREIIRKFQISENLSKLKLMTPTNVFLEFEIESSSLLNIKFINFKENYKLSPKCKIVILNISANSYQDLQENNQNLQIFPNENMCKDSVSERNFRSVNLYEIDVKLKGLRNHKRFDQWNIL